jgi:hypothetical protein
MGMKKVANTLERGANLFESEVHQKDNNDNGGDRFKAVEREHTMARIKDRWIYKRDGKLVLHTENAEYHNARRGLEEADREINREEAERNFPEHNYAGLLREVDDVFAGRKNKTRIF